MVKHQSFTAVLWRIFRRLLFTLSCVILCGAGVLWARSVYRTDILQLVTEKMNCSRGRREWSIETYRGGLLFDVRNIVYERLDSDPMIPDSSTLWVHTEPEPQSSRDVNAGNGILGRMGFVASNYSAVVREHPVVTQMGQSVGLPFWAIAIVSGLWPALGAARLLRLRRPAPSNTAGSRTPALGA